MFIKGKEYFTNEQCKNIKEITSKYGVTVICDEEENKKPDIVMPTNENCEKLKEVVGKYGVKLLCKE